MYKMLLFAHHNFLPLVNHLGAETGSGFCGLLSEGSVSTSIALSPEVVAGWGVGRGVAAGVVVGGILTGVGAT